MTSKHCIYVLKNECLKKLRVPAGKSKGKLVFPLKIGSAKELESRLGTLNTSVFENFEPRYGLEGKDIKWVERLIHLLLLDYRIMTKGNDRTEFFACPEDEAVSRIKKLVKVLQREFDIKPIKIKNLRGRSASAIRANRKKSMAKSANDLKKSSRN